MRISPIPLLCTLMLAFICVHADDDLSIGTPLSDTAKKVMLLGSGELGKELAIELQRLGVEVIAVDRYEHAPAMQVAHRSYIIPMLDPVALRKIIEQEKPHLIVPEIEAIATDTLKELESEGYTVIPTAYAVWVTMNRERIRRLAAEDLGLKTSAYEFAQNLEELEQAVEKLGLPCVVKPIMSSSGKGQSVIKEKNDIQKAWDYAQEGGRAGAGKVIVEEFIDFDYEITLLTTLQAKGAPRFCDPIGHRQEHGDYVESWQPQPMSHKALQSAITIATTITKALGGRGTFGVEMFVKGNDVYFSEVSPRPHDTGMVTLASQDLSEFAIHARAILGLPIPHITLNGPAASYALLVKGTSNKVRYRNLHLALEEPETQIRLFGKPNVTGQRRMGVALARGETLEEARERAQKVAAAIEVTL